MEIKIWTSTGLDADMKPILPTSHHVSIDDGETIHCECEDKLLHTVSEAVSKYVDECDRQFEKELRK